MSNKMGELEVLILFGQLRRQVNLMATAKLRHLGVGPKQALLMSRLLEMKRALSIELARATQTDPAATGKVVDGLVRKGWANREHDSQDRRCWKVQLTSKGESIAREVRRVYQGIAKEFCKNLSSHEQDLFVKTLVKISSHLEKI